LRAHGLSKLSGDRTAFRDFADDQSTPRFMPLWSFNICSYYDWVLATLFYARILHMAITF